MEVELLRLEKGVHCPRRHILRSITASLVANSHDADDVTSLGPTEYVASIRLLTYAPAVTISYFEGCSSDTQVEIGIRGIS
jgi:hypothetical protein